MTPILSALAQAIKKVATGPHLSKDLTQQEAFDAMNEILAGDADPVQAAIFFIALRIKTETHDENFGILQALQSCTQQSSANVEQLLILSDPFNGFNRHCPISAFLPAVLAASDLPSLSQGVKLMGPKFGVTHSQVLAVAGFNVDLSIEAATAQINTPEIAWTFIDQQQATPQLYELQDLRTRMIKRPSLATLEKMVMPIKAQGKTHLQIGFVHKSYPAVLAKLAVEAGFASAFIIRGIEGGIVPTLRETSNCFQSFNGVAEAYSINPKDFDIEQTTRGVLPKESMTVTAEHTADLGLKALAGQTGDALDTLILGGASALWHCGLFASKLLAAAHVRHVIKSGRAAHYFEQGVKSA